MTDLNHQLTEAFPPPATRAEKEHWVFTKPQTFTRSAITQTADLDYSNAETWEHTLQPATWHQGQHALTLESNEQRTLVEFIIGDAPEALLTDTLDISLQQGSTLRHIRLHAGTQHQQRRIVNVTADENATYQQFTLTVGGTLSRTETLVDLIGEKAHAEVVSLNLLQGEEKADTLNHTHFKAPSCTADIRQRNVVADAAHAVFQGKFHVDQIAQQTDAYMLCQNILLGEKACASHKPELEIYADDVKCSHGATTGTLDEAHLFYLQARGIPKAQAKQMLIAAQVHDLIDNLPDAITARALALTEKWLKGVSHA
ncbi:MAG: SufD family Fe-S cluster assembly protein [Alphaproteobacteria bacterium]|nr:SufD family Fe-S cluster assembly protein [Alphaproteobacteria bacterium]MDD9919120.1 SufD family Fe-S cluster assembly protein [Alphaproteobacteria bacterium]